MTSNPIRAALERLIKLDDAHEGDRQWEPWVNAIDAARAALAAAPEGEPSDQEIADVFSQGCRDLSRSYEPPFLGGARAIFARWGRPAAPPAPLEGEGPSESDVANLFYRHMGEGSEVGFENAIAEALARWGRPAAPPAPLEGEVGELVAALRKASDGASAMGWEQDSWAIARAATLLEQLSAAAPAVVPIPVSERLPKPEDCDTQGQCWRFHQEDYSQWNAWCYSRSNGQETHWLPAHAIPLPAPQGGEVEG